MAISQENQARYEARARELAAQMTVEEKASQLSYQAPAIPRLGIPAYNWWNEALHGVARAGVATMFPQAVGLAASFDPELLREAGRIVGLEARIKYNAAQRHEDRGIYKGLTLWSPNINIYRDPRWGRGHETYGEDPVLTATCGENYIRGIQEGDDDRYLHAAACVKHIAAHSGPEGIRHGFDSKVSPFDLNDTYLPAFEWCVKKSGVEGIMGAYNMINGIPACAHPMIQDTIREKWGFQGYFVSDCGALADMHQFCLYTHTAVESAAAALKAGCDLNCGNVYLHALEAYNEGLVSEEEITRAAVRVLTTRIKLGLMDPDCAYHQETDYLTVECGAHRAAALRAAEESLVLLKNNGVLPLKREQLKTLGVIGPNAASIRALEGNYNGLSSRYVTVLQGIQEEAGEDIRVLYGPGCHLYKDVLESCGEPRDGFAEALSVAENSDAVIMVLGLDSSIEGEEGDANNEYGAGDKGSLRLPGFQQELLEEVVKVGKPVVLVVLAGGALDLTWAEEHADGILYGWYPGSEGGRAVAEVLFGRVSPSGRTPVTFPRSLEDLPPFEEYSMVGRTYRYMEKEPLYPFGFGLSYTSFSCGKPEVSGSFAEGRITLSVEVTNTGNCPGDYPVQVYARFGQEEDCIVPRCKLCGLGRSGLLAPGERRLVRIPVEREAVLLTHTDGSRFLPESFRLGVCDDSRQAAQSDLPIVF